MTRGRRSEGESGGAGEGQAGRAPAAAPGKTTHTQRLAAPRRAVVDAAAPPPPGAIEGEVASVQLASDDPFGLHLLGASDVRGAAAAGTQGAGEALPHHDRIQSSFGQHDVSGIRAHVGGAAADAAGQIGARAYASGNDVAFASTPDLHTAAHEAAHVVQQRGGVQLYGGVGEAGDRYEQHADAVADAVVRGESAEPLLNEMAGGGHASAASAVQRQEGGRGSARAVRASGVRSATAALLEAVELAQLALATNKAFVDGELTRVNTAAKELADALHTESGALSPADAKALDKATGAAYSLQRTLTIGQHARPKLAHELLKTLGELKRTANDPGNDEPPRAPGELIPVAAENVAKLRVARVHVVERILDYPSVDLQSLDKAITESSEWLEELAGPAGTKAALRLTRPVLDQADVLAEVVPELTAFLTQPLTESSDEVVYAFVLALAHSTKRADRAQRTATLANRARKRQRFDEPRSVVEDSFANVASLGELNKKEASQARQEQHRLERRVALLENRAMTGGKVSNLDRDQLLIEAREHDYKTHVRVLELQLRSTADGLDGLDDGFTGGVNRYSDTIPTLVSDLRGIAKVAAAAREGYRERVKIAEAEASDIDDEPQRNRYIADKKLEALDWLQMFIVEHIQNNRLEERLKTAMAVAERAQTRLFIANLLTTIVMTLAGNMAASAMRGAAEGAFVARATAAGADAIEAAQAAKTVGTATFAATDVLVNTIGQKVALGDKRSFLTVLGANAVTALAVHAVQVHFVKIEHMIDDISATSGGWTKLAAHSKKFAVVLPELSMSMIVGAAADHAVTRAVGYDVPPADKDALVSEWMAQGAAMAIGRHIAAHSDTFRKLSARLHNGARKWAHARVLAMDVHVRGAAAMRSGDIAQAQAALAELETLMAIERAMVADELERIHPNRRLADDTLEGSTSPDAEAPMPPRPDRDPFSREGLSENSAAIKAGEPGYNSVVGHVTETTGVAVLQRLMRGDASALAELGYKAGEGFDPSTREWGLGKIGNKYVIVAGEPRAVDWSALNGVEPVAHSHPIDPGRIARHRSKRLNVRDLVSGIEKHATDAALVFSSPADVQFAALRRLGEHTVALPYEHLGGTDLTLASSQPSGRPQVILVLKDATFDGTSPHDGAMRFRANATMKAGDEVVWHGTIDAVFPKGGAARLEFDAPARAGGPVDPASAPVAAKTKSGTPDEPPDPTKVAEAPDAAEWVTQLEATLTADEQSQFTRMRGQWQSPEEIRTAFKGDLARAKRTMADAIARYSATKASKASSASRVAEMRETIKKEAILQRGTAAEILAKIPDQPSQPDLSRAIVDLRSELVGELRALELREQIPGAKVLREVKVYERTAHTPEQFAAMPQERKHGHTLRNGHVYRMTTDIDELVLEPADAGPGKIVRMEQLKTGRTDTSADAKGQNQAALASMVGARNPGDIRLEVGNRDVTHEVDLSSAATAAQVTVGPQGKGFDESIGVSANDLERLVTDLVSEAVATRGKK